MSPLHRVVMLVNNDWRIDSRVMREAATLAGAGHEVHVVSRNGAQAGAEPVGAVTVHNVPSASSRGRLDRIAALLRSHWQVVGAARELPGGSWIWWRALASSALSVLALLFALPLLPALLPLGVLMLWARAFYRRQSVRERLDRPGLGPGWRVVRAGRSLYRFFVLAAGRLFPEHIRYLNEFGLDAERLVLDLHPTVVHAHDLVTLSTGFGVARKTGSLLVYDAHELETHTNYWSLAKATHRWIAIYENALIRHATTVVTVCDSIADWLGEHYGVRRPVVVLNSPDLKPRDHAAPAARSLRASLGLGAGTPLAVYVGAVSIDRGLVECVKAAALVKGLHFAFVGPRYSVTEAEIRATADSLGIADRIHLVDPVPSREVSSFVACADCSVIAIQNVCLSYYYCFPNKLLESVMSGLPVAAARLVELERFLGRFPVGVTMDETDPASIASAIDLILADPGRYKPGPDVLERIRAEFGWAAQQARLLQMYGSFARPAEGAPAAPAREGEAQPT